MIKYFINFFNPITLTYQYPHPKDSVIKLIHEILNRKITFFGTNDMTGEFITADKFVINVSSPANTGGAKYGSTLFAEIIELSEELTLVKTKALPSSTLYILFFINVVLGLTSIFTCVLTLSLKSFLWTIGILFIGPVLIIGLSNAAIAAVELRYKMYIHEVLLNAQLQGKKATDLS